MRGFLNPLQSNEVDRRSICPPDAAPAFMCAAGGGRARVRGKGMEKIVPLIGMSVKGPLGVAHLPRFWLKAVLAAVGRACPTATTPAQCGMNKVVMEGSDSIRPPRSRISRTARPMPRSRAGCANTRRSSTRPRSPRLSAKIVSHQKSHRTMPPRPARAPASAIRRCGGAGLLNALDDWATLHEALIARRGPARWPRSFRRSARRAPGRSG